MQVGLKQTIADPKSAYGTRQEPKKTKVFSNLKDEMSNWRSQYNTLQNTIDNDIK